MAQDSEGRTPVQLASGKGYDQIVKVLLKPDKSAAELWILVLSIRSLLLLMPEMRQNSTTGWKVVKR